ncbi:SJAG_02143-like, conserved protein [Schizosaccharomyces osmophilus]|uniref:SJAG_02143-like, conserved protein n=1 Tax=Schizosaccharomyces osmophilus TaxID=2545709 RepID=A0AAE9WEC9_9SCHI|nr:SJAG_02143-like, conserved protein [Schizosaccharomyces osmophilus]WBW74729.1 SJAG_02143-like, conserved protein [Schizosaccharomyces osmophilus]
MKKSTDLPPPAYSEKPFKPYSDKSDDDEDDYTPFEPPSPPSFTGKQTTEVASVSLHEHDKIRFINFPPPLLSGAVILIQQYWPRGIRSQRAYGPSHEIKLSGTPWLAEGYSIIHVQRTVKELIAYMMSHNWKLYVLCNVSEKMGSLDSWFFLHVPGFATSMLTPKQEWSVITFENSDRIRIIDGSQQLISIIHSACLQHWYRGLKSFRLYRGMVPECKLRGFPWAANGTETMYVRLFVAKLIELLESAGYSIVGTLNIFRTEDYSFPDSWVLLHP